MKRQRPAERQPELIAPVVYRSRACSQADATGLPQTVYSVISPDQIHWFEVATAYWHESRAVREGKLTVAGCVTFLPVKYFDCACTQPHAFTSPCLYHTEVTRP